jgi:hypothetical protein
MSDPFGSLDPSSSGGPIEEPRLGFLSRFFRRRRKNPSQLPEGDMLDFESGPPVGHQATETPTATPTPMPQTPSPTPPARLGSAPMTSPPQWPAPVKVSSSGGFPVGVVVVILIIVAIFGVGIVSCVAALDEGFDAADEAFDDFSNDFTANTPLAPDAETGPAQEPNEFIPEFGTDSTFDRLANECHDGNMAACDELYRTTPIGDARSYEGYGATCGGRVETEIPSQCVTQFGADED